MARSLKQHFTDWCREQGDAEYDYGSNGDCALCRFLNANGYSKQARVGGDYWRDDAEGLSNQHFFDRDMVAALVSTPHTFAALADRLAA